MTKHPTEEMARALEACSVDPRQVEVEWDALCQEDVLTFAGKSYPSQALERLAELSLTFPSRFVFSTDILQADFEREVWNSLTIRNLREEFELNQKRVLEVSNLSTFPAYQPDKETLAVFTARVEKACGLKPGEVLVARDNTIFMQPVPSVDMRTVDIGKVLALVNQAAPTIQFAVTGASSD